uniref:MICOS complex subunit MIC13 n=1 Tax=Schistosoma mansoni TaxID=6183 RepID=A0AA82N7Y4_SCHMA
MAIAFFRGVSKFGLVAAFGYFSVVEGVWSTADKGSNNATKVREVVPHVFSFLQKFPDEMRETWNENVKNLFTWTRSNQCSNCNMKQCFNSFGLFGKKS